MTFPSDGPTNKDLEKIRADIAIRRAKALASISESERNLRNEILEAAAGCSERMGAWAGYLREQSDGDTKVYWDGYVRACVELAGVIRGIIFHGLSAQTNTVGNPLIKDPPPEQIGK